MPKFTIQYTFDGWGKCDIEAKTKEEAKDKFASGDHNYDNVSEGQGNEEIQQVDLAEDI